MTRRPAWTGADSGWPIAMPVSKVFLLGGASWSKQLISCRAKGVKTKTSEQLGSGLLVGAAGASGLNHRRQESNGDGRRIRDPC